MYNKDKMIDSLTTALGKIIRKFVRLTGGHGSALPGLIIEKINPNYLHNCLKKLPFGVVLVSGTNGKTTTTKMITQLLRGQGLKVFTNDSGSNFTRGIIASLVNSMSLSGKLDADIAVLELDEAYAVHFSQSVQPRYTLLLNVMRDQLDRFGEIDKTANLLKIVARQTTRCVILNREDPRLREIGNSLHNQAICYFGLDKTLLSSFPDDDHTHLKNNNSSATNGITADVILKSFSDKMAVFQVGQNNYAVNLKINGIYNVYNSAAAICTVKKILEEKINLTKLISDLSNIEPAFGRGEILSINKQPLALILVKNPAGFNLSLKSFNKDNYATMIAINDNYADSRDVSWLWDVDFTSLNRDKIEMISGLRAYDMALRLQYDGIRSENIETDLKKAIEYFLDSNKNKPKRIFCTYTAMLYLRKILDTKVKLSKEDKNEQ